MAATLAQTTVLQLVTGMFAGAPGKTFLDQLTPELDHVGQAGLAVELANTDIFKSLYPTTQGGQAFAQAWLSTIVVGFTTDNATHAWAMNWMASRIDAGTSIGQVVFDALTALRAQSVSDPTWGASLTRLNDWTTLATKYSVDLGLSGTSAAELRDVLHAPVFSSADVNGATLTLHYTELNGLDAAHAPAAGAFTVMVDGLARSVSSVTVDATAKTVALTLAIPAFHGSTVTVAYADPTTGDDTNAIQDVVGNDALALATIAVTNNTPAGTDDTPPIFASASVDGIYLEMDYLDATGLDANNLPSTSDFTVKVDGDPVAVTDVQINGDARKVYLTLATPVTDAQAVTVAYTDPSVGDDTAAIQDIAGHDASTLAATAVTNISPDTTAPEFDSATVVNKTLVMTYTDTSTLDASKPPTADTFTVMVGGKADSVTAVAVNAADKTVTLTLHDAASIGQAVTVAYADPTGGNDAHAIQDAEGNDAASLKATDVTNNSADNVAPVFVSAAVDDTTLVLSYSDISGLDDASTHAPATTAFVVKVNTTADVVTAVAVDSDAKTVSLTLKAAVTAGQTVTVAYTDPTTGNDTKAIQDSQGNDAATFSAHAVTNNTGVTDVTAPELSGAVVDGTRLVMSYIDSSTFDTTHKPATTAFGVTVDGDADVVKSVAIDAAAHTVTLTLATAVTNGQTVTLDYTDPTAGNDTNAIQDSKGNDAATVSTDVTNVTIDATVAVALVGVTGADTGLMA